MNQPHPFQPWRKVLLIAVLCLAFLLGSAAVSGTRIVYGQAATPVATTVAPATAGTVPGDNTLVELYKKVIPSVVTVYIKIPNERTVNPRTPATPDPSIPEFSQGNGSGFVYSDEGYIVTNAHVVEDVGEKGKILVTFYDDLTLPATVVGIDPDSDMAVIKVETEKARLVPLILADSDKVQVGERVVAIGNPFRNYPGTMTEGIISAINRRFDSQSQNFQIPGMIQTDAAINPGNSGGPLLDMSGAVVGINTAIETRLEFFNAQSSGVGFAVPSNLIRKFAPKLIKDGRVEHAYLGISGGDLDYEINGLIGLKTEQQGILVREVIQGSPADKGGLKGATGSKTLDGEVIDIGGDIIVAIDGVPTRKFEQLLGYLFTKKEPGDTAVISVLRDGKTLDLTVTLTARPHST